MAKRPPKKAAGTSKGNVSEPNTSTIRIWLIKSNPMFHSVSKFLET
jgi:hypothetical protein